MNVAIVGSRPPVATARLGIETIELALAWARYRLLIDRVRAYVDSLEPGTIVVSGGARGVDKEAEQAAKRRGLNVRIFYPNWERGMGAGFARNRAIVHASDVVTAFWDGVSRGTRHTIGVADEMGKPLMVYTHEGIHDGLTNTTMRAFGPRWTNPRAHVPTVCTPVGMLCGACDRAIADGDKGLTLPLLADSHAGPVRVVFHHECWIQSITGPPAREHAWTDETTD